MKISANNGEASWKSFFLRSLCVLYSAERFEQLGVYYPTSGRSTHVFNMLVGHGLRRVGEVTTPNEVLQVAWFTPDEVRAMIAANEIRDGSTLTGLLWYFLTIADF